MLLDNLFTLLGGTGTAAILFGIVALVGMRGPGMEFKELYDTMLKPWRPERMKALTAGLNRLNSAVKVPVVPVQSASLRSFAGQLGRLIWRFNFAVNKALIQLSQHLARVPNNRALQT